MPRSDEEVIDKILKIYQSRFGGKQGQRFLIGWLEVRDLYPMARMEQGRFTQLWYEGVRRGVYLHDLDYVDGEHLIAVIRTKTVNRWRRVPKRLSGLHGPDEWAEPGGELRG